MELIDKNKIHFTTIEPYEYANEPMEVAFKEDIEELPIVKGISIDKLHEMCDEIKSLDGLYNQEDYATYNLTSMPKYVKVDEVTKIINKYIASEGE
jgi:hypothetical protein